MSSVRKFGTIKNQVIFRHPLRLTNSYYPSQIYDTTLIPTVLLPSGDRPEPHAHTLTQFFDSAGQSCGFHCQSHNTRWRESNRVRVWQWLEYLPGHCSWLCISPQFWMGIFSSQVQHYYRRWLEINIKSSEGSLKPHQLCSLLSSSQTKIVKLWFVFKFHWNLWVCMLFQFGECQD